MNGAAGSGSETPSGGPIFADAVPPDLELVRLCTAPEGCFGVLLIDGIPIGPVTLERTYPVVESRPRGPQYVKIPRGQYRCIRTKYYTGNYDTFEVTGVPGHSRLLFHAGNVEFDSEGCILVGRRFGLLQGQPAVLESIRGFGDLMALLANKPSFDLVVRSA